MGPNHLHFFVSTNTFFNDGAHCLYLFFINIYLYIFLVIADSEAKINEVNESLENQILDKIQVEEKFDEFKDEIQKKNSEVKGKRL